VPFDHITEKSREELRDFCKNPFIKQRFSY
jgi:hypothetical protein